jgi:16S rRNA (adenine(1408)-N(1))-methyltransferase
MAEASARASRTPRKGGVPNALFLAAAAEAIPDELTGLGDLVTVRFPWASLLRGVVGRDDDVAGGVASLVAPGGTLEVMLAPAARDRLEGLPTEPDGIVEAVRAAFEPRGLRLVEARKASTDEIVASHSTWAKRLLGGVGRGGETSERGVLLVRLRS